MLMPAIFSDNMFDDFFGFPDFNKMDREMDRKLYGHHEDRIMKTDVKELDNEYELMIDLPGFTKDEITAELNDGYLTITAEKNVNNDEQEKKTGRYIRRERYTGTCRRSFYVGSNVREEDIKAGFNHGILKLEIPKNAPALPEKKYIAIEG